MSRIRPFLRLQSILVVALFFAWLGVGSAHQHAENPTCQVCKLLQHGAAELALPAPNPAPGSSGECVALTPTDVSDDRFLPLPCGRAPPLV
jgi:hypothetical protein